MVNILEWEDSDKFAKQEYRDWYANGEKEKSETRAGWVKNAGRLTFLMIEGAGHMVSWHYCFSTKADILLGSYGQTRRVSFYVSNVVGRRRILVVVPHLPELHAQSNLKIEMVSTDTRVSS
jgi:hypothetical protein